MSSINVTFCHTCGFRYKAQWLAYKLSELLPSTTRVTTTPVTAPLGSFVVSVDGNVVYEKSRSFHGTNPQPTPSEVDELVRSIASRALCVGDVPSKAARKQGGMWWAECDVADLRADDTSVAHEQQNRHTGGPPSGGE